MEDSYHEERNPDYATQGGGARTLSTARPCLPNCTFRHHRLATPLDPPQSASGRADDQQRMPRQTTHTHNCTLTERHPFPTTPRDSMVLFHASHITSTMTTPPTPIAPPPPTHIVHRRLTAGPGAHTRWLAGHPPPLPMYEHFHPARRLSGGA